MVQLLWETAWQLLKRLNIESPRDPATQLLAVDPKGKENLSTQNLYTDVLKSIVLIAKRWKQSKSSPVDKQIKYGLSYNGI